MTTRPYTPEQLQQRLAEIAAMYSQSNYTPTAQELNYIRGQVAAGADQVVGKEWRHGILHYLTGYFSTKNMPVAWLRALHLWLYPDSGGGTSPAPYTSKSEGGSGYGVAEIAVSELLAVKATMITPLF